MSEKKVLVIDDDTAILDALEMMLGFEGYRVSVKDKGAAIFRLDNGELPDIILLDMWLCEEDGRDICRRIKSLDYLKNTPVIMMSASRGLEQSALEAGANDFVAKPFDMDVIIGKVRQYLAS